MTCNKISLKPNILPIGGHNLRTDILLMSLHLHLSINDFIMYVDDIAIFTSNKIDLKSATSRPIYVNITT